jgi:hypothetical protein
MGHSGSWLFHDRATCLFFGVDERATCLRCSSKERNWDLGQDKQRKGKRSTYDLKLRKQ